VFVKIPTKAEYKICTGVSFCYSSNVKNKTKTGNIHTANRRRQKPPPICKNKYKNKK